MTRIFDNIELNLGGHLVETLSESNRIDAAVGYFNIRGWKLFGDVIHGRSAGGPPIARVLVGMVHGEPEEQVLDHLLRRLLQSRAPGGLRRMRQHGPFGATPPQR